VEHLPGLSCRAEGQRGGTDSTPYLTDDDLTAIAHYLKSLPARREESGAPASSQSGASSAEGRASSGSAWYEEYCVTCHRADGGGVTRIFPTLAGNDVVETEDPTSLIHIMLSGGRQPRTTARPTAFAMPAFNKLDDRLVAAIVTYIRTAWGNSASGVTAEEVAKVRAALNKTEAVR
jgi:mono/diheme cytochrome c family protein